jgi:hypothetical protein
MHPQGGNGPLVAAAARRTVKEMALQRFKASASRCSASF